MQQESSMSTIPRFYGRAVAVSLVATGVLSLGSVALQPELAGSGAEQLAAIDDAGPRAAASLALFAVAQLFAAPGLVGVAHLMRGKARRLATAVAVLGVMGAFGHTAMCGANLVAVSMAGDRAHRAQLGAALDDFLASPAMTFAAVGLLGTVLAILLLAVGLWRTRLSARWVPWTLVLFLVLEFAASNVVGWASVVSGCLFLAAMGALGATVLGHTARPEPVASPAGSRRDHEVAPSRRTTGEGDPALT
jgi:hypothetical protein